MKIASKSSNICIKSNYPKFKYHFKESGVPVEVSEEHVTNILLNSDFYESDKSVKTNKKSVKKIIKKKSWEEELEQNFTKEEIIKITESYKTKGDLLEAISNKKLTFSESLGAKLEEVFVH